MIPRRIEERFQGRYVYTLVIPIENLPVYQGDWIVWFAEKSQRPGDTPLMRAPMPFRKLEPVGGMAARNRNEQRLQFTGTITREGKIEGISMLTSPGSAFEKAVIQDLASWDFKPATRDGLPVDIDIVVEIPFNLSVIAERGQL
jgi:TonB family protein